MTSLPDGYLMKTQNSLQETDISASFPSPGHSVPSLHGPSLQSLGITWILPWELTKRRPPSWKNSWEEKKSGGISRSGLRGQDNRTQDRDSQWRTEPTEGSIPPFWVPPADSANLITTPCSLLLPLGNVTLRLILFLQTIQSKAKKGNGPHKIDLRYPLV